MDKKDILTWAAKRAFSDQTFLGYDLHEYCRMADVTERNLSQILKCSAEALNSLALCLRPIADSSTFREDVERIAAHCGADAQRLVEILRQVDSIRTMRIHPMPNLALSADKASYLMAARDRPNVKGASKRNRNSKDK